MIRTLPHILVCLALVGPAQALTPLPPCSGVKVGSYETWNTRGWGTGFVSSHGMDKATRKAFVMLEHCKTGKTLWTDTFRSADGDAAGDIDVAIDALYSYLESDRKFTLNAIKRGMKAEGLKVKNVNTRDESCGCHVHFPDHRGNRKEFTY